MIEIKRLVEISIADAVRVWNEGFQGYFVDMTVSADGYLARLNNEGLAADLSLVAIIGGRAAGFLLNGIRNNGNQTIAWNGGTGVASDFRRQGVGKVLVEASLELYREHEVDVATLEAISTNTAAIKLYEECGYEIRDKLVFLNHEGTFELSPSRTFAVRKVAPHEVSQLSFYRHDVAWQTEWQSMIRANGEALIVFNDEGDAACYALYRRKCDEHGRVTSIAVYQCEVNEACADGESVVASALQRVFEPEELNCRRMTSNLRKSNELVCRILKELGFSEFIDQVRMVKQLNL